MLSFNKIGDDNVRAAIYAMPGDKSKDFYLHAMFNYENLIPPRTNITEYIDPDWMKQSNNNPLNPDTVERIIQVITQGIILNPKTVPVTFYNSWSKVMSELNRMMSTYYIAEKGCRFYIAPTMVKDQHDVIKATGQAGIGKSWIMADYTCFYHHAFPENKIYLLAGKPEDKALDQLTFIERIKQEDWDEFMGYFPESKEKKEKKPAEPKKKKQKKNEEEENPENGERASDEKKPEDSKEVPKTVKDFKNSLFLFDDIENIKPDKAREKLYDFKSYLTGVGRSSAIDIFICDHVTRNYQKTREELIELTAIVLFPIQGNKFQMESYLRIYLKLGKKAIKRILNPIHRWVMIYLKHPMTMVNEKEIWVIND